MVLDVSVNVYTKLDAITLGTGHLSKSINCKASLRWGVPHAFRNRYKFPLIHLATENQDVYFILKYLGLFRLKYGSLPQNHLEALRNKAFS